MLLQTFFSKESSKIPRSFGEVFQISFVCVVLVALFNEYFWVRRVLFLLRERSSFAGGVPVM